MKGVGSDNYRVLFTCGNSKQQLPKSGEIWQRAFRPAAVTHAKFGELAPQTPISAICDCSELQIQSSFSHKAKN